MIKTGRLALLLVLGLPVLGRAFPYELTEAQKASVREHLPYGLPSTGELLFHQGYVVSHNNWLKIPNWAAYHVSSTTLRGTFSRSNDFRADEELKDWQRSSPADYRRSGYDQGHMAPAGAMKRGEEAMSESFLLSNMVPQVGVGFNRGVWRILEDHVREWALAKGEGWVFVGPAFLEPGDDGEIRFKRIGQSRVAVPTHNFMILVTRDHLGALDAIAFLLPNAKAKASQLSSFIVSIHDIEKITGLDFMADLPDEQENELEGRRPSDLWTIRGPAAETAVE